MKTFDLRPLDLIMYEMEVAHHIVKTNEVTESSFKQLYDSMLTAHVILNSMRDMESLGLCYMNVYSSSIKPVLKEFRDTYDAKLLEIYTSMSDDFRTKYTVFKQQVDQTAVSKALEKYVQNPTGGQLEEDLSDLFAPKKDPKLSN